MMVIDNLFDLGSIVYLKTDSDQKERIVCQITIATTGIRYMLCCGVAESWHYEFEMNAEKNVLITTTN